jgi:hypothetical protein
MEVQMVAREIGEAARGELHTVHPAECQRMARHLHHHRVHPLLDHDGEQRLQVGGLGRGERAGLFAAVDPHPDGADQTRDPVGGAQSGLE